MTGQALSEKLILVIALVDPACRVAGQCAEINVYSIEQPERDAGVSQAIIGTIHTVSS